MKKPFLVNLSEENYLFLKSYSKKNNIPISQIVNSLIDLKIMYEKNQIDHERDYVELSLLRKDNKKFNKILEIINESE